MNRPYLIAAMAGAAGDWRAAVQAFRAALPGGPRFMAKKAEADEPNELFIYDVIGDDWFGGVSAKTVADAIKGFDKSKPVNVYINSPGGSVWEGAAIYNQLARFKGEKHVFVDGLAASAASYIAMVGDKITTGFNAMWMIHNPWTIAIGNYQDLRALSDDLEKITGTYRTTYSKHTGKSIEDVTKIMDAETWYTAEEALAAGFTDAVTSQDDEEDEDDKARAHQTPAAAAVLAKYRNAPAAVKPTVNEMIASMEARVKNLPKPASRQRLIPGQPGTRS